MIVYKVVREVNGFYLSLSEALPPSVRRRYKLRETMRPRSQAGPFFAYSDLYAASIISEGKVILKCEAKLYHHSIKKILIPAVCRTYKDYKRFWSSYEGNYQMNLYSSTVLCAEITPLEVVC